MKKVTIKDVAAHAGVSNATVSAVINNKDTVKESTRLKVLQAIDTLGYRPSASAQRRFQRPVERSIGLIIKEIHNPYFADIIVGVQQVADEKGYNVLVASSERDYALERRRVELLAAKDVDGLIINPLLDEEADLAHLFELKRRNIPFVLLESVRGLQASLVDVDNVAVSKQAVEYLIGLGHTRIVHFAGPPYSMHSDERIEGVRRAFSASRLVLREADIVHAGARLEDGYRAGLSYFKAAGAERPTAVTCYNDLVAIGLVRALRELDISVPEDVSVVGYDDIEMAEYAPVALTSVHVPRREMGARAAELLIRQVEAPLPRRIEKLNLPAELVLRASTRAPAGTSKTVAA